MSLKFEPNRESLAAMLDLPDKEDVQKDTAIDNYIESQRNRSEDAMSDDQPNEPDNQDGLIDTEVSEVEFNKPEEPPGAPLKLMQLPFSRLKSIIKLVPSVGLVNSEAAVVIGKATELFLRELVTEAHQMTLESGKKTLSQVHVDGVIQTLPQFEFLEGMLI